MVISGSLGLKPPKRYSEKVRRYSSSSGANSMQNASFTASPALNSGIFDKAKAWFRATKSAFLILAI